MEHEASQALITGRPQRYLRMDDPKLIPVPNILYTRGRYPHPRPARDCGIALWHSRVRDPLRPSHFG